MGSMISRKEPYVRAPSSEENGHPQPQPMLDVERGMSAVAEISDSGREGGAADLLFDMEDDLVAPLLGRSPEGAARAGKENAGPGVYTIQLDSNVGAGESASSCTCASDNERMQFSQYGFFKFGRDKGSLNKGRETGGFQLADVSFAGSLVAPPLR